jgi:hypothetical protein
MEEDDRLEIASQERSVLERLVDEAREGNDQRAIVPETDHGVGQENVLHETLLALDEDRVAETNRLGDGELNPGNDPGERRSRSARLVRAPARSFIVPSAVSTGSEIARATPSTTTSKSQDKPTTSPV